MKSVEEMTDEELEEVIRTKAAPKKNVEEMSDEELDEILKNKPESNKAMAALQGFGKEATLGYLPEIQAASQLIGEKIFGSPTAEADEKLKAMGISVPEEKLDTEYFRARQQKLQEEAPGSFLAGQIAGGITGGAATGAAAGKIAQGARSVPGLLKVVPKTAGTLTGAVGEAALTGAAYNPEETEGDRSSNAILGGATAGLLGGATRALGGTLGGTSKWIREMPAKADLSDAKASVYAIGANKSTIKPLIDPKKGGSVQNLKKLGDFIKSKNILSVGDSIDDIAEKTDLLVDDIGRKLGELHDATTTQAGKLKLSSIVSDANKKLLSEAEGISGSSAVKKGIESELQDLQTIGLKNADPNAGAFSGVGGGTAAPSASLKDLMEYRTSLWKQIYKGNSLKNLGGAVDGNKIEAQKRVYDFLTSKIDEIVESGSGENAKLLKKLNNEYRLANQANQIAQDRFTAESGNNFYSLRDNMAGAAGIAGNLAHDPSAVLNATATGLGMAAASKALRTYGRPVYQAGMQGLGAATRAVPETIPALGQAAGGLIKQQAAPLGLLGSRLKMSQEKKKKESD